MSKISREENKKRFKTGMYPTQQDFENVFDSFVHKDDTIDPSKIVSGDENIVDIINRKAEERHSHEISDVEGLNERLQQIQDDLDTAEDNISGHETRIQTLETSKTDYEEFKERVRAFLEDADTSDKTINRWKEIENFLQGITDTETLTGLLNDLKQEILNEIPEPQTSGNYLEQVSELDAYTDAPDGKIVQYIGQTNDQYTRGFLYERIVSGGGIRNVGTVTGGNSTLAVGTKFVYEADLATSYWKGSTSDKEVTGIYSLETFKKPEVGDIIYSRNEHIPSTGVIGWEVLQVTESNNKLTVQVFNENRGVGNVTMTEQHNAYVLKSYSDDELLGYMTNTLFKIGDQYCVVSYSPETEEIPASESWQQLHTDNVIS